MLAVIFCVSLVRWDEVGTAMQQASVPWLLLAIGSVLVMPGARVARGGRRPDAHGRAVLRRHCLGRGVAALMALGFSPFGTTKVIWHLAVGLFLAAACLAAVVVLPRLADRVSRGPRVPRWARFLSTQFQSVRTGWKVWDRRQLVVAAVLTLCIMASSASTNALVFKAFGLTVALIAALSMLVVLQLGTAVVSVPGNVGVFHFLTVWTLAQWEAPSSTARAVAVVLHLVSLRPKVLLAAPALIWLPARGAAG